MKLDRRTIQYRRFKRIKTQGVFMLLIIIILGLLLKIYELTPNEPILISPLESDEGGSALIQSVEALEPTPEPITAKDKIMQAWGKTEGKIAVKVAFCESSLRPEARHKTSSASGLFQITDGTWNYFKCKGDKFDADDNITCAYKIYQKYGWGSSASWLASKPCWKGIE